MKFRNGGMAATAAQVESQKATLEALNEVAELLKVTNNEMKDWYPGCGNQVAWSLKFSVYTYMGVGGLGGY